MLAKRHNAGLQALWVVCNATFLPPDYALVDEVDYGKHEHWQVVVLHAVLQGP